MKAEKFMGLCLVPHFFAISLPLSFIAAKCGLASFSALSYEIAPMWSQSLMVLISSACFIISSFIFAFSYALDFKGRPCDFQGENRFFCNFSRFFCEKSAFFSFFDYSLYWPKNSRLNFSGVFSSGKRRNRLNNRLEFWLKIGIGGAGYGQ